MKVLSKKKATLHAEDSSVTYSQCPRGLCLRVNKGRRSAAGRLGNVPMGQTQETPPLTDKRTDFLKLLCETLELAHK